MNMSTSSCKAKTYSAIHEVYCSGQYIPVAAALYAWADRFVFAIYLLALNVLYSGYVFRVKSVRKFSLFLLCAFPKIKEVDVETPWFSISNTQERYPSKYYIHLLV